MPRILVFFLVLLPLPTGAQSLNGFDLSDALIPSNEILRGGPPRDGIPSIDHPVFKPISDYHEFNSRHEILGVYHNGVAKAYPINIMDYHEVVNDDFAGEPVVITYCPLCGSGIAFESRIDGKPTQFGVSGLLYNSDVLLYDRTTESLWSQIMAQAVSGPAKGRELSLIRTRRMTLGNWKKHYPQSLILTTDTGYTRSYHEKPYGGYDSQDRTYFPVSNIDNRFHKKEWIIGIEVNNIYKAYPVKQLSKLKGRQLVEELGGKTVTLTWEQGGENVRAFLGDGSEIPALQMFWFAWVAFHPDTQILGE